MGLPKKKIGGRSYEKSAKSCGGGKTGKTRKILKGAIGLQQRGDLDLLQSQNHRIDQRQDHLAQAVEIIALKVTEVACQIRSYPQLLEKLVKQINAPEVG